MSDQVEIRYYIDPEDHQHPLAWDRQTLTQEIVQPTGHYIERTVAAGSWDAMEAARRLLTMFTCTALVCLTLASSAGAQDAGTLPDAGTVYAPLVLCISPYVIAHDRAVMARAAAARGFDVFVGHSEGCSVTLFVGDGDATGNEWISYNEGRKLHRARATDLLIAWEARLY